ncbi:hypothetical protein NFI96_007481 [Prochilodus magdalenae]|nr:hypothetical protein NFI96_007481 [Prochilodus magdalenae]
MRYRAYSNTNPVRRPALKTILEPAVFLAPVRWEIDADIERANSGSSVPECCPPARLYVPAALPRTISSPGRTPLLPPVILERTEQFDLPFETILSIDRFSRGVRFVPFPHSHRHFRPRNAWFNHVFRFFGIPEDIVSDRGVQFTSRVWRAFMRKLGVSVSLTSGYHPQSNGQCGERANQELAKFLRVYCHDNQSDWATYLPWAEMAQNSLTSSTTSLTPFQCILGFQPPLMPWSPQSSDVPAVDHWMRRSEEVWEQTHRRIESVAQRQKEQADKHRGSTPVYSPGDRVWLSSRDLRLPGGCKKLSPKYIGPYRIVSRLNDVT